MAEHTPTPWRVDKDDKLIVCFGEGDSICDCAPGSPFIKMGAARANAAFIVTAVNNHKPLVAELKRLFELYGHQATADVLAGVVGKQS